MRKMVSNTIYLCTDEGWLYVAAIMDIYARKVVCISMNERMTEEFVINALNDVYQRSGKSTGVILFR